MEKQKKWQLPLIFFVLLVTLYNILPTFFYYRQPLSEPINTEYASQTARKIAERIDVMPQESIEWVSSFAKNLDVTPESVSLDTEDPSLIKAVFSTPKDKKIFTALFNRAAEKIPFVPAQLSLVEGYNETDSLNVYIQRVQPLAFDLNTLEKTFTYLPFWENTEPSSLWQKAAFSKAQEVLNPLLPPHIKTPFDANQINAETFLEVLEALKMGLFLEGKEKASWQAFLFYDKNASSEEILRAYKAHVTTQLALLDSAHTDVSFQKKEWEEAALLLKTVALDGKAFTYEPVDFSIPEESSKNTGVFNYALERVNPLFKEFTVDFRNNQIDIRAANIFGKEDTASLKQLLGNYLRKYQFTWGNGIVHEKNQFSIPLVSLKGASSALLMDLRGVLSQRMEGISHTVLQYLQKGTLLNEETFPLSLEGSSISSPQSVEVMSPLLSSASSNTPFKKTSIYVVFKDFFALAEDLQEMGRERLTQFEKESEALVAFMESQGFVAFAGSSPGMPKEYKKDLIFEYPEFYAVFLNATRESFDLYKDAGLALLPFSNVEQRLFVENKIDDAIHEDLLKWRDEWSSAKVDMDPVRRLLVPPPAQNVYWQNFLLTWRKIFRGDESRILQWGLDLSGGKSIRMLLKDASGAVVSKKEDLEQTVSELYQRVNSLGVSEKTVRVVDDTIVLEVPGSQKIAGEDLVDASRMSFHIVNEQFGRFNPNLKESVHRFLQEVWNEAVVTGKNSSIRDINLIAWEKLGGNLDQETSSMPRSFAAEHLFEEGLKIAHPDYHQVNSDLNEELSSVMLLSGEDPSKWLGQTHPLLLCFSNFALVGSDIGDVVVGYDTTEGNTLTFSIKSLSEDGLRSPRNDFYAWTSAFSQDSIVGTEREGFSQGQGWRMAVVLNDRVISSPSLKAALRDKATISGRFTQREINQLSADLKAGSLSFQPEIISERFISPELGEKERLMGARASLIALCVVVLMMVFYYRFSGLVASVAVLFNLLIIWGVLQNMGAALTLPGIAGIVLTIGMAVDANVLVFERFKEEFARLGKITSALQLAYKKAFTAIFDSNFTTILTGFILLQFDSGPIKGFAITLIIGIVSSMFTALFMTKVFFMGWIRTFRTEKLSMSSWLDGMSVRFTAFFKPAFILSLLSIVIGLTCLYQVRGSILGMDFVGGYSFTIENPVKREQDLPLAIEKGFSSLGFKSNDYRIRQEDFGQRTVVYLSHTLDEEGRPFNSFSGMEKREKKQAILALVKEGLTPTLGKEFIDSQDLETSWSVLSGQFSQTMRNNAILGLSIALLSIFLYLTIRFEWVFALSAVIALCHDIVLTLGVLALFNLWGYPVEIDLAIVGAFMTIIGYSLNDTIIIFDRIREDHKQKRGMPFKELVNSALNATLARTIITSATTLAVLLCLLFFGGSAIFGFSLVMAVGVFVGTFSSLFIATPTMLYLHGRYERGSEEAISSPPHAHLN